MSLSAHVAGPKRSIFRTFSHVAGKTGQSKGWNPAYGGRYFFFGM
jgi:hypothetical protein